MNIAIVGAGVGGLVSAVALQRRGHAVTVFERAVSPGAIGAGLSLFANAADALKAVGLGDVIKAITSREVISYRTGQRTPTGRWLTVVRPEATASLRVVHRQELHQQLLGRLGPGTLLAGSSATVPRNGHPTLEITSHTGSASTRSFDLVVAADGIRSPSRRSLGLDTGIRYAGYTAWRGITDVPVDLGGEAGETWGFQQRFGIAPLTDGRVYWFAVESSAPGLRSADERQEVVSRFGRWHEPIGKLISHTPQAAVLKSDVYDLARPLQSFIRGRTLLLGDAAHAMTPDLGQGAGQAIEDAATLTLLLDEVHDELELERALRLYDRTRRTRSQPVARRARLVGAVAHTRSRTGARMRDGALRLMPRSAMTRAALKAQRWTPPGVSRVR